MATKISFKVHRREPELVTPARPTPRVFKLLSDIDDQLGLRFQVPFIFLYRPITSNLYPDDPVVVIKKALAETLVYYYPFAGRLRELSNRKLAVDCTGEGVLFIEADADVTFAELEEADALLPPFPCLEELLFDVEGSSEILNTPLLLFQVTRLKCGGFILAIRFNHTMTDAAGISLFLKALCEFARARGSHIPSVLPVWDRHLLTARNPARVTHMHREYENEKEEVVEETWPTHSISEVTLDLYEKENTCGLVTQTFFFGDKEISAIRRLLPAAHKSTTLETLTAFLWRLRTVALSPEPNTEMRLACAVSAHSSLKNPPLPSSYYGNASFLPMAITTARDLTEKPLEFALKLIKEAKTSVTEDYVRSVMDLMVTRGRPKFKFTTPWTYLVTDFRRFGFGNVDLGPWGKPVYGGTAKAGMPGFYGVSFCMLFTNKKGETGIVVPICLPVRAMERFVEQLDAVLNSGTKNRTEKLMVSSL